MIKQLLAHRSATELKVVFLSALAQKACYRGGVMHKTILMSKELECKKTDKNKKH